MEWTKSRQGSLRCKYATQVQRTVGSDGNLSDNIIRDLDTQYSLGTTNTPDMVSVLMIAPNVTAANIACVQ